MSRPDAVRLYADGMALLGKTIAVHSHDAIGAFSVINELAGLQLDLLQEAAAGEPIDLAELEKISQQIRSYARSGDDTVKSLNYVAHRFDDRSPEVEIGEALAKLVTAAEHLLNVRRVSLVLERPDERLFLRADPFLLACAVLFSLDVLVVKSREDKVVTIGCQPVRGGVEVTVENDGPVGPSLDRQAALSTLEPLLQELGGEVKAFDSDPRGDRITLVISRGSKPEDSASGG